MGNSNSQFKRSRSQYGSTRSVAFSLPPVWGRHSYAYSEQLKRRRASIGNSTMSTPPKSILRSRSVGGSENLATSQGSWHAKDSSQSLHLLHDSARKSASYSDIHQKTPSAGQLTPNQFNDIYLNNDLRRVFRSQDRSKSVANVSNDVHYELDSATSLDRKLLTLKAQRATFDSPTGTTMLIEEKKNGAIEKRIKSRKSKKAPQPILTSIHSDNLPIAKTEGLYKKKGLAPHPPLRQKARSLSSLTLQHDELPFSSYGAKPLFQEIEHELERRNIPISSVEKQIDIPKPDYDGQRAMSTGVLVMPSVEPVKLRKTKSKAPPVPAKPKHKLIQDILPISIKGEEALLEHDVVVHDHEDMSSDPKAVKTECSTEQKISVPKVVREIAIQCDAPVDIAIQCTGNTLKQKSDSSNPDQTSLSELLHLFTEAQKGGVQTSKEKGDTESVCSKTSSCERNASQQKVIPMSQVLADVPEPPPLPDFGIKLLQQRTIKVNAPVSMAPGMLTNLEKEDNSNNIPPRSFSSFQEQLMSAYEKIEQKRKSKPSETKLHLSNARHESVHPLDVFRYSDTILGIQTPQEAESDSGHDEPSDSSNSVSHSEQTSSIPDFVLAGIVTGIHAGLDEPRAHIESLPVTEQPVKKDKSKFNSIKRLKKSVRHLMLPKRQASLDEEIPKPLEDQPVIYSDSNWTLSGRSRSARTSITEIASSVSAEKLAPNIVNAETSSEYPPESLKSSSRLKHTNMKSFSLLTPMSYPGTKPHQTIPTKQKSPVSQIHSLADVPL
ncbi:uncharacterized protein [Watersipora subatra]